MHVRTEGKFKVGDRVRRIKVKNGPDFLVGDTGVVTHVADGGVYVCADKDGSEDYHILAYLEPAPRFKVGDRVRATEDAPRGKTGTIRKYEKNHVRQNWLVEFDDWTGGHDGEMDLPDSGWWLAENEIEPATDNGLRIQTGRYYKTRDGRKVGPMEMWSDWGVEHPWQEEGGVNRFTEGGDIWRDDGTSEYGSPTLIAEWPSDTGCAAAEVDNLRDEYGPFTAKPKFKVGDRVKFRDDYESDAAGAEAMVIEVNRWGVMVDRGGMYGKSTEAAADLRLVADATSGKFKVGDRVRITNPANFRTGTRVGDIGVVTKDYTGGMFVDIDLHHETDGVINQIAKPTDIKMAPNPAIVARIDNGQPEPATNPYVHADRDSALREAARLAKANPGKEFGVYEYVSSAKEAKVYEHEWQRLAAEGDRDGAATELHRLTGMRHSTARYVADTYA